MEIIFAVFSFLSAFVLVLAVVCLGWYLVWKLFLSKFRLVRELLGGMTEAPTTEQESSRKTKVRRARRE